MQQRLFCYETLMVSDIISRVIGHPVMQKECNATLYNYGCFKVKGEIFPGIRPTKDTNTQGLLYNNLALEELQHLDLYEGELYQRQKVCVETEQGPTSAWCYIVRPEYHGDLTGELWCQKEFLSTGIREFLGG